MKKKKLWLWLLLLLAWIGVIFWHSSCTAAKSDAESLGLLVYVRKVLPFMTNHLIRKLGHFTEFAILGWLMTKCFSLCKNFILLKPLAFSLFVALCDETIQLFVPGRSGNIRDVWIDFAGVILGTLLMRLIFEIRKR